MGGADFVNVLFSEFLIFDPDAPTWSGRDRFFMDPGHMSPMLYAQLALLGRYSMEELQQFRQWGSPTPGHPEVDVLRGVENTSGPLGQGHTFAVGAAIAAKFLAHRLGWVMSQTIYAYISDGGIQEEISQGAGRIAGHLGLDNLIMYYDANNIQLSTTVEEVDSEDVAAKYKAWGWHVIEIDGCCPEAIRKALREAKATVGQPTLIIGKTIMGRGAVGPNGENYENRVNTHGQPLSAAGASIEATIKNLGGDPEAPDGFLKKTRALARGDFGGAFLQPGVAELTMACLCIGMALHGGVIAACGTFFVFSDYMKPAIRMAALMELPVKFVWSHDAFRVGEDGPTHEPVEQEAQIRLMEKLQNHHGADSVRVLRPSDVEETTIAWRMAMENTHTPTALILSRQNINDLPAPEGKSRKEAAEAATRGGYIVLRDENPEVVLIANGSEVSTLVEGAALLRKDGIRLQIVAVPSEGLFRCQSQEYQDEVLPRGIRRFGLTAGLPVTLQGLVGDNGAIWGLSSFGFSAPYKVLDEKLGFTPDHVYKEVKALLSK